VKRKLGSTQRDVLRSLVEHDGWSEFCGWVWTSHSQTEKFMKALVARGLATDTEKNSRGYTLYRATPEGIRVSKEKR